MTMSPKTEHYEIIKIDVMAGLLCWTALDYTSVPNKVATVCALKHVCPFSSDELTTTC